ncbi:Eco57I restriction-modification methylase domain-containing protein [Mycoplasmopsis adleri]|uniref:Eco57I restriction-modification methylase domain-containing protein n=1 Tax=Mycoplasmopsis adleri TaxID=51362 RepID=UPI0038730A43
MNNKKVKLGQFFTKDSIWLKPQIIDFIKKSNCSIAYDPFAGGGDLLNVVQSISNIKKVKGLDIDPSLTWELNDSLNFIPHIDDAIIITNPPYIAKQSASKKKIDLSNYFKNSIYDDVYLIALDRMLEAQQFVVAIIPESFLNSSYKQKDRIHSITILEENPFEDTENPVCVVCFDNVI